MHLLPSNDLKPVLREYLPGIASRLAMLVPSGEFHHIGATAITGALTKGDVDVLLRVEAHGFASAVSVLKQEFAVKQPTNWSASFASFGDDSGYPFPLGIQLVVRDAEEDFFLYLHDYLSADPARIAEYNHIKAESAPHGQQAYWQAKHRFLSAILAARQTGADVRSDDSRP